MGITNVEASPAPHPPPPPPLPGHSPQWRDALQPGRLCPPGLQQDGQTGVRPCSRLVHSSYCEPDLEWTSLTAVRPGPLFTFNLHLRTRGGEPLVINFSMRLLDIYHISHSDFTISIGVQYSLSWIDNRLVIIGNKSDINLDVDFIKTLWVGFNNNDKSLFNQRNH